MEIINKILRVLVCIVLIILVLFLANCLFLYIACGASLHEAITHYLGILFISFSLILCIFILNKRSEKYYNMILLVIGIFIIWRRYIYYLDSTLVKVVIYDIVPLFLVYLSTICNYLVYRKQK